MKKVVRTQGADLPQSNLLPPLQMLQRDQARALAPRCSSALSAGLDKAYPVVQFSFTQFSRTVPLALLCPLQQIPPKRVVLPQAELCPWAATAFISVPCSQGSQGTKGGTTGGGRAVGSAMLYWPASPV